MRVIWTPQAELDRLDIFQYIINDNQAAALRMDELFSHAGERLGRIPQMGRAGVIEGTREYVVHRNYRLVYEIAGDEIWILALVHTARQWPPKDPA
ncbi:MULTISPECIES: type II toxin-antitoxin system RelE/ParE family toxin [Rhizobium]|uniref:type II toxin-antitoxin system RelE/ParE family toxin n=1 Tax=Rhizobium TaxID=379 RepID=UPI00195DE991|nr:MULTISPECIES: type II toxin-antitoxin system RelE/ParE family toxin [Rhizobium]MBM7045301.1 type II toxin-antitoxin system RelE/ParE family toxin [Rhizobium lusitanum]